MELLSVKHSNDTSLDTINQQAFTKRSFIICENCHWCATLLGGYKAAIDLANCPNCKIHQALSIVPIADNEVFIFSYNEKHGVELDFMPKK
jgi:hypothetical protein